MIFAAILLTPVYDAWAAVRDATVNSTAISARSGATGGQRVTTSERVAAPRTTTLAPRNTSTTTASRADATVSARSATSASVQSAGRKGGAGDVRSATGTKTRVAISGASVRNTAAVSARAAAIDESSETIAQTRIGAEYERCKSAFFTCMDQFCTLKNDDYRRCSCSSRVFKLTEARQTLTDAGQQLTVFTENLDVVGMTAAQAKAMKTASEGENALTADTSASKALLQAIMNSIRGEDSTVGGKYSDLNSINISFDTVNAFGMNDAGQAIAKNNGQNLYTAVYPQCRAAVKADCNDASLQRAINAYLMAIEQDCNTVQAAIEGKQKELKSAIREGSAMLDLARVENRQKHNSSDIATCVAEVEAAILSEEVCGASYHRCLDNGEYIDLTTGAPIAGVVDFYKLGKLLNFAEGVDATSQTLTRVPSNRTFVINFEKRVKKFAQPALDKCTENADAVWSDYLDKAMLDIYYAQQSKVDQIKQGCFDFVSACYMNGDTAITAAMKALTGDSSVVVQPSKIALNDQMCKDYVDSCNNMFDANIVADYIDNRKNTDTLTACRAVVQQCFDKYGGKNYENFYYPYSGLFKQGEAPDWFTLYEFAPDGLTDVTAYPLNVVDPAGQTRKGRYVSECAKQLTTIEACSGQQMIEDAFGGLDLIFISEKDKPNISELPLARYGDEDKTYWRYGTLAKNNNGNAVVAQHRYLRPTGVATEVYNQVVDMLSTQCFNLEGRFVEYQFIKTDLYGSVSGKKYKQSFCISNFSSDDDTIKKLRHAYVIGEYENMCPRDYDMNVDTYSWGACLCWENGGRRSKWGKSTKCVAGFPVVVNSAKYQNGKDKNKDKIIPEDANDVSCADDYYVIFEVTEATNADGKSIEQIVAKYDTTDSVTGEKYSRTIKFDKDFPVEKWCVTADRTSANQTCIKSELYKKRNVSCDYPLELLPKGVSY